MKPTTFSAFMLGLGLGAFLMLATLNVAAHDTMEQKPGITLHEYWEGK